MTIMFSAPASAMDMALALSATLAFSAGRNRPIVVRKTVPAWVPWLVLGALGAASCGFGMTHPMAFAAAFSEGFALP